MSEAMGDHRPPPGALTDESSDGTKPSEHRINAGLAAVLLIAALSLHGSDDGQEVLLAQDLIDAALRLTEPSAAQDVQQEIVEQLLPQSADVLVSWLNRVEASASLTQSSPVSPDQGA